LLLLVSRFVHLRVLQQEPATHSVVRRTNGETMHDPISVLTLISMGLKSVDQFRELVLRVDGVAPMPPSSRAEQAGTALEVRHLDQVYQRIEASELQMNEWDATRYEALSKRIRLHWDRFNEQFVREAAASGAEHDQIRTEMQAVRVTLCRDFREMVTLYERALGTSLPDHYQLYEVCS
jgi:hypothetical protein